MPTRPGQTVAFLVTWCSTPNIVDMALPSAQHALSFSDADVTLCGDVFVPFITMPVNEGVVEDNDILATASKTVLNDSAKFSPLPSALRA